jgi:hypothetical protein
MYLVNLKLISAVLATFLLFCFNLSSVHAWSEEELQLQIPQDELYNVFRLNNEVHSQLQNTNKMRSFPGCKIYFARQALPEANQEYSSGKSDRIDISLNNNDSGFTVSESLEQIANTTIIGDSHLGAKMQSSTQFVKDAEPSNLENIQSDELLKQDSLFLERTAFNAYYDTDSLRFDLTSVLSENKKQIQNQDRVQKADLEVKAAYSGTILSPTVATGVRMNPSYKEQVDGSTNLESYVVGSADFKVKDKLKLTPKLQTSVTNSNKQTSIASVETKLKLIKNLEITSGASRKLSHITLTVQMDKK